jgi:hypothetical protein
MSPPPLAPGGGGGTLVCGRGGGDPNSDEGTDTCGTLGTYLCLLYKELEFLTCDIDGAVVDCCTGRDALAA